MVALFAITLLFWWHFPPLLFHFDGTFRHHNFFLSYLSGGAFCRHFAVLTALFAPHFCILTALFAPTLFRLDLCGGAFCPHFVVLGALSAPICTFWGRFLPPFSCFGGAFCPHTVFAYSVVSFSIASASDITFSAISAPSSGNPFVSGGISTSSCSLITEAPTATS